ncbi:porin [Alphaproteobacteria bacterium]|nr:porin [Alphaproteobacteria bacterium]
MRKILLTTTAFVALGSVAAVAADVSVSGNARFRYNTWSDDNAAVAGENNNSMTDMLQLWIQSSATTDNGLAIGTNTRIRTNGTVDRNWIDIDGDFGKLDLGKNWSLSYSGSLHEVWAGTVAGGAFMGGSNNAGLAAMNTTGFLPGGNRANKIQYHIPSIGGFNAAIGYEDAGAGTDADQTASHVSYTMPFGGGNLKINMTSMATSAANATSGESDGREVGVEYSGGFGRVYALSQNTETTNVGGVATDDQEGTTFGGTYNVNSAAKVVYYRQEMDQDGTVSTGDKFSSNTVGLRYDIAGGLRVGLLHSNYDFTDASNTATSENGSATRLEVRVNF